MIKLTSNLRRMKEIERFLFVCSEYSKLRNEAIVPFIGYSEDNESEVPSYSILSQFMPNWSLENMYTTDGFFEWWNFTRRIIFLYGVSYGINYLHQNSIIHEDLNFSNILISAKGEPKVTDYMLSSLFPLNISKIPDNKLIFIAPEILDGQKYTKQSDVYSLGIVAIMLMMDNMNILNENLSGNDLVNQIKSGLLRALPECIPSCMHELLLSLISIDPSKRPSVSKFIEDLESFFPNFVEQESFDLQIFTEYKDKITLAEDTMSEECKQTKRDADGGDPEAMYRYAFFRSKGKGCKINETEAWHYYQLSAERGFEKAKLIINASKSKNSSMVPIEPSDSVKAKINANKLNKLKERLRNKKSSGTVISEEKNLLSNQNLKLKMDEIQKYKEFSRLADDTSFNEDKINISNISKEIIEKLKTLKGKLPNEFDKNKIAASNFILTDDSENRLFKIINYIKYKIPVLLEGPTGTSKTLSAEVACKMLNDLDDKDKEKYGFVVDESGNTEIKLNRFNLSSETKTKDLIGRYVGNPSSWAGISQEDGPFYKAFKEGQILLLDEINLASPSVLQCIEEALDSGYLSIEIPGKPLIPIPMHENFRLIATQNPNKGLFAHKRQDLGLKFYSHFQVINFPAFSSLELKLIAKGLAKQFHYDDLNAISQLADFHKEWSENPDIQDDAQCFTIREMAATVHALGERKSNIFDTIMTFYGARYQAKKKNDLLKVLKKYPKLIEKGESKKIPSTFTFCYQNESLKETVKSAIFSLVNGRHVIISGKEGCGKTQVALWISHYFNTVLRKEILINSNTNNSSSSYKTVSDSKDKQFYCICTEDTKVADLVGHQSPAGKAETGDEIIKWIDGFLTEAIKIGKCSVLESIDEAPATVTERLNGLLDQKYDNKPRYFDIPENPQEKSILITDTFRILATCDIEKIDFVSPAFLNRFDVIVLEDQITKDTSKDEYFNLTRTLLDKFFKETCNNKKLLKIAAPSSKLAVTDSEVDKISSIFHEKPEIWNNMSKISKVCKAISIFLIEFEETSVDKRKSLIEFALNLLSGDREYKIPDEIEGKFLDKLNESSSYNDRNTDKDIKSTDPEFYFKKSPLLCTFMAKLMAFSLIQQPVCVSGPTGAGKTSAARKFARMRRCHSKSKSQFQMHSFHAGTKTSQFYGTATLANGQIDFVEGTLTTALKNGDVFIADEFNLSPQSVMKSLAPALEQTVGSNIYIPGINKEINISSEFFFIACQNDLGTLGRNAIPETISPRFVYIDYPKPELKDLSTICMEIAKEKDENGDSSSISPEIASHIAEYMQDINSLNSPYITPWSLRDISKIFRRIRFQENVHNKNKYIGIDNYHHIFFYTLSSVPKDNIKKVITQIEPFFNKLNPDFPNFVSKYVADFNEIPTIKETEIGHFIMKGEIGVCIESILTNMLKKSILKETYSSDDKDDKEQVIDYNDLDFSNLKNLWNTAFQICLSDCREPILLMGNSGFKTFLAQQVIQEASIISLNQETTVAQLLGSSGFFTASEAKHFYIKNLCNICYDASLRISKLHELQNKWEKGDLTKKDIEPAVKSGHEIHPSSFNYMIDHLSSKLFKHNDEERCVLSNTTLEFRPGLFLNAILQKQSLILKDLSNLPTIVLERFNELFSGKQNITLTEDIHDTFTSPDQKELTDFNSSFRVIGTCPTNTPSKLSEAVLSRFTVIATPEYDSDERKIVLESLCKVNKFDFQIEDIELIIKVSDTISAIKTDTKKLKPYTFAQMIKTVQLTSKINKLNPGQQRFNLNVAIFRILSGLESKSKKEDLFNVIKSIVYPDFPEYFIKNEAKICPLGYPDDDRPNKGILSKFTHLFIDAASSHEYISDKKIALTSHFCDMLDVIHFSIAVHNPLILEGPPGQGKHTAIEYVANMLNLEVIYITISQSTKVDDLLGKLKIERKKDGIHVDFTKSKLVETISLDSGITDKPIIVIENINNATPAVLNALLSIFNVEIKDILLPIGETMKKGEFNLIGIFNTQQSTSTRDKLPSSLIYSTIYYVVKEPSNIEIEQIIKSEFTEHERDEAETNLFIIKFFKAKKFLIDMHLPKVFTLNDISKYLLFRDKTATVFPNTATIMQMIFVYRFFQASMIESIREALEYEIMTFMPYFGYDSTNSYLLVRVTDDQKVLKVPLLRYEDPEKPFDPVATISKVDSLTSTQKYCLIFMVCALLSKRACVIQGSTSSGKSFIIRLFAELIGAKLNVFQMNTDSSIAMLAGQSVLNEKLAPEDVKSFQDYLETISKIEEINDYLLDKNIKTKDPSTWTPKIFSEMLKKVDEILEETESELKEEVTEAAKNIRELLSPVHRFDNKESELIRAMREGQWVLIDGIESAPPEIAEKIASLCGENPELNLFECGPEYVFSRQNGKIHENFQLFITYNPIASKNNQSIDQSFLIKSVSFTLPEVDSNKESSSQVLFGSMINQHYPDTQAKEVASRLGTMHNAAKKESISRVDSFAGDIQFTGRTIRFITQVFKNFQEFELKESGEFCERAAEPIAFCIQSFYLNSLIDLSYYDEFKDKLLKKFQKDPITLIKKLEMNQKSIIQRNYFVLLCLRNIQRFLLKNEKVKYEFNKFMLDCNSIQTSDISLIIKHFDDTISIMTQKTSDGAEGLDRKFGSLKIINKLLKDLFTALQRAFKVEHSCLKLSEKELTTETELSKPLSRFYLVTKLSNHYMSQECSVLLNSSMHNEVLLLVKDVAIYREKKYIKSLLQYVLDKPESCKFIYSIFPGHIFVDTKMEFVNFVLPIVLKCIINKVHFKLYFSKDEFIESSAKDSPFFYLKIHAIEKDSFDIDYDTKIKINIGNKKKPIRFHTLSDSNKAKYMFYNVMQRILDNEKYPLQLNKKTISEYFVQVDALYKTEGFKYTKITQLSNFFRSKKVNQDKSMICFAWNLITSLDNSTISAIKEVLNPFESYILDLLYNLYQNCTFGSYENIFIFSEWAKDFDEKLPILLKIVSNIEIADKKNKIVDPDLINRIEEEKDFLNKTPKSTPPEWNSKQFIDKLDLAKESVLELSEELKKRTEIEGELKKIKEELLSTVFIENEEFKLALIEQIDTLPKTEENLKLIRRKCRQYRDSIVKNTLKDDKNRINWPPFIFPNDKVFFKDDEMKIFEILMEYSNILKILKDLKESSKNRIKVLPRLNQIKSMRATIISLNDYYIKNDGYPENLIAIAHHEMNVNFLYQLLLIDKSKSCMNPEIQFKTYNNFYEFYKIANILNKRINRTELTDDELNTVYKFSTEFPTEFELVLPDITPNDMIYFFIIKARKNNKDEILPGPLLSNITPPTAELEKLQHLFTKKFSNFTDAIADIARNSYKVFGVNRVCPDNNKLIQNEIYQLQRLMYDRPATQNVFIQLITMFEFAKKADNFLMNQDNSRSNYKFSFDDLSFLDNENYDPVVRIKKIINIYPSFAVWGLKNAELFKQIYDTFRNSKDKIKEKRNRLPLWLHCLRVFSSSKCIEFIPRKRAQLKPIASKINETIFEKISIEFETPIPPSTDWLNLIVPTVPADFSNQFVHMIYLLLQNLCNDPKIEHSSNVISYLSDVVKQIIDFTFRDQINNHFNAPLPDFNDHSLSYFFRNPATYIVDQIELGFRNKCVIFANSDKVLNLYTFLATSADENRSFIEKMKNAINDDKKQYRSFIKKKQKDDEDNKKRFLTNTYNSTIKKYTSLFTKIVNKEIPKDVTSMNELKSLKEKLVQLKVKFTSTKVRYSQVDETQNIDKLISEHIKAENKQQLEQFSLMIIGKGRNYSETEFINFMESVHRDFEGYKTTFLTYVGMNQLDLADNFIQAFYNNCLVIVNAQTAMISTAVELENCKAALVKMRSHFSQLKDHLENVKNELANLPKNGVGNSNVYLKSSTAFQNSYEIIYPSIRSRRIDPSKATYFRIREDKSFQIPVISLSNKKELKCSVNTIKCIIEPLIPSLYSEKVVITIISLVDEPLTVELNIERNEYFTINKRVVDPRNPIQILATIPSIEKDENEVVYCQGELILTLNSGKSLTLPVKIVFQLIPMKIKLYCEHYNLCDMDSKFRLCCREFFSGESAMIQVSNIFNSEIAFSNYAIEVETDNEADEPEITYKSTDFTPKKHYFKVLMQTTKLKKLHFTLKIALTQHLVANILFNCMIVPFNFYLEAYDYRTKSFVSKSLELFWGYAGMKQTLHFRVMCPCIPRKVYAKVFFKLPNEMKIVKIEGLDNPVANRKSTSNSFSCIREFSENFVFSVQFQCLTDICPSNTSYYDYAHRRYTTAKKNYEISAAFALQQEEFEKNCNTDNNKILISFRDHPKVLIDNANNVLRTDRVFDTIVDIPIYIFDHNTQKFIRYREGMKTTDFSGSNRPLSFITPFEAKQDQRNETKVVYQNTSFYVKTSNYTVKAYYTKLGTDGIAVPNLNTPDVESNKIKAQPLLSGRSFLGMTPGACFMNMGEDKPIIKYPFYGELNTEPPIWFPAFTQYPPNRCKPLEVTQQNVKVAHSYLNYNLRILLRAPSSDSRNILDYKAYLNTISNDERYIACTNFAIFMLIMIDKSNLRKVSDLINSMPKDFRKRCPEISKYIPPETAFKGKNDLLIIYSCNIINEFARIFEQRYNEIQNNGFSLESTISENQIFEANQRACMELFNFDTKKQFVINNPESPNSKAHDEYKELERNITIPPLPPEQNQHECFILLERNDPIPSSNIDLLIEPKWNLPTITDVAKTNDNNYIENPPVIRKPDVMSIESLNQFYLTCSQAASVLPVFLSKSQDNYQALNLFVTLLDIYIQLGKGKPDYSIISEATNSFINSFDGAVFRLKKAHVEFNFLNDEELAIINRITTTKNTSEWITIPKPDLISLTSTPWKTKQEFARDLVKEVNYRLDVENNLSLENDFRFQQSIFENDTIINNEDESPEIKSVDTAAEEKLNEDAEFIIKNFAADESDEDALNDEDKEEGDGKEDDTQIVVLKNIGKVNRKNLNQGKAADSMLSNLKEKDGIERVISRIHSIDATKGFTFKNSQPDNKITDEALLHTSATVFPVASFANKSAHLISLLASSVSDNKIGRANNFSSPFSLISVNLLIDCSSYIPEANKMFNILLLTSFAFALNILRVPYEISVVADQKFRFILKSFEEPHSIQGLQRVLDCVLIQRYRTNYPDTFHHAVEFMKNEDEKRTQRAIFLFSDGLDENLVLIDAWNKQVLNNPSISFGLIVTEPQALDNENKKYIENVWKKFQDGTKDAAASITRLSIIDSNMNSKPNLNKIAACFKDVMSRPINVQSTYEQPEYLKPVFDYNFSDLRQFKTSIFEPELPMPTKIFVSLEKSVITTSNKIHVDKLEISHYRGKTAKIVSCNVDKAFHDSFAGFIHRVTTRQKNIFRSQLETIFKPNKASQTVLSNTGTDFDITALVLNLINPVPDPFIYLEEKGGLIRNYGVTVVIDTSISCFNFIGSIHSVKTMINILCALSSIEIPCIDVILATEGEPIVLCSEVPSVHALGEKSPIWPSLFSYLVQHPLNDCNLEDAIHAAYDLRRMRGIDYTSYLFVLTDGLYMVERKEKIKEQVMASIQLGINVIGIGIGTYPLGITDIFQQSVFAPNPSEIIRAISVCFGDDNPDSLEKISPLLPDIAPYNEVLSVLNKFKDYDQNPVFRELKEKLKRIPAAIDAFSDVYNEEQDFKGKSYKDISNPEGKNTEMYIENVLKGQKILIVMLYNCDLNLEESQNVCEKFLSMNPDPSKEECVRKAVAFFGIDIVVVEDYDSAMTELMKRENGKCIYYATWVISGWKYENVPYDKDPHHVIAFTQCLLQFWKSGGAVVLFAEGEPLTFQANYFLEQITFPDGSKTKLQLSGSHEGKGILYGDDEGSLSKPSTFNRSSLEFKKCQRASLSHNLIQIYEGETISFAEDDPSIYKPFIPFSKDSNGGISALFYPFDPDNHTGDIIIDCGYTKLFDNMTANGTFKYVQNIAGWTAQVENSIINHIKPKDYRPEGFEFDISKYINEKYQHFEEMPIDKEDEMFNIEVEKMQTLFAVDYSGSTRDDEFYYSHIQSIFDEKYKNGDMIMIWSHVSQFIDHYQMMNIIANRKGSGGTTPQKIIELILNTRPKITAEHLIVITDGWIDVNDVSTCIKIVNDNNVKFKMVDTYVIGGSGDQSVGTIFQKKSPSTTHIYRPNKEPEIEIVSPKDIRIYDQLSEINTLGQFNLTFNSLFKVIKTKMMGNDPNQELEIQLQEVKTKVTDSINKSGTDSNFQAIADFNRKIDALIKMAKGEIKNIFNNSQITAMLKTGIGK